MCARRFRVCFTKDTAAATHEEGTRARKMQCERGCAEKIRTAVPVVLALGREPPRSTVVPGATRGPPERALAPPDAAAPAAAAEDAVAIICTTPPAQKPLHSFE